MDIVIADAHSSCYDMTREIKMRTLESICKIANNYSVPVVRYLYEKIHKWLNLRLLVYERKHEALTIRLKNQLNILYKRMVTDYRLPMNTKRRYLQTMLTQNNFESATINGVETIVFENAADPKITKELLTSTSCGFGYDFNWFIDEDGNIDFERWLNNLQFGSKSFNN